MKGGGRAKSDVVFVVDLNAYRRGHAEDGEVCHVINGGPVPVEVVKHEVDDDGFIKAVLHDGVKIDTVKHFGRHISAPLRTALELGPPPDFLGERCGCGCGKRFKLQKDHIDPVAHGGATAFANLQPLVNHEHIEKTRQDRRNGLLKRRPPPDP